MDTKIIIFFLLFASVVFGLYFCLPKKHRHWIILIASLVFYAVYSKFMTAFLVVTILSIYLAGLWLNNLEKRCEIAREGKEKDEKKKIKAKYKTKKLLVLWLFIVINLGMLVGLKYFNFFGSVYTGFLSWFNITKTAPILKVALPLGISYYTLSSIGYMIDVERGKYKGETNFVKVALFVSYFPSLLEGPFATYDHLGPQLYEGHEFDLKRVSKGLMLICWGFFKLIVVANRFSIIVSEVFNNYANYNGIIVLLGVLCYTIKLYADFSGAIDVARGVSEMFGIELAPNFRQPFFSQTVNEFWRRWHISLGAWFKEYVFYSISMSKGMTKLNKKLHGKVNTFFEMFIPSAIALLAVWVANGLWHGSAIGAHAMESTVKYIVYGLYWYAIMLFGMCIEPLFNLIYSKGKIKKDNKWLVCARVIRTFIIVNIGFMMFKSKTLTDFGGMFAQIFKGGSFDIIVDKFAVGGGIDVYDLVWCFIGLLPIITVDVLLEKGIDVRERLVSKPGLAFSVILLLFSLILVFGAYGDGYIPPDPEYGGF